MLQRILNPCLGSFIEYYQLTLWGQERSGRLPLLGFFFPFVLNASDNFLSPVTALRLQGDIPASDPSPGLRLGAGVLHLCLESGEAESHTTGQFVKAKLQPILTFFKGKALAVLEHW